MSPIEAIDALQTALSRSIDYFLKTQHPDGYWVGELESNATITAEVLFAMRLLNLSDPAREEAIQRQLLSWQADGGWSLFYGNSPDLNTTLEAAVALQLAGMPLDAPELQRAAEVVRELGGLNQARVFTRIWLALLKAIPWDSIPAMPPEMILLPDSIPLSVNRFASWARGTIVPLLIILAQPPSYQGPSPTLDHFMIGERPRFQVSPPCFDAAANFARLDFVLNKTAGILKRNPWRKKALLKARTWLESHQEADGGWGGIQPAMINSVLALATFDPTAPSVKLGLQAIESFCIQDQHGFRMQACVSPGWDTPWVMLALLEAGLPPDHPALDHAARWLFSQQSYVYGDWSLQAPGIVAGGWPFEFYNSQYPDTDDTALVLAALHQVGMESNRPFQDGLEWMLGMQNDDGGWAAFDRENNTWLVEKIPFCDFGEVLDPSSADVTAHVLELLALLGYDPSEPRVKHGLAYLWANKRTTAPGLVAGGLITFTGPPQPLLAWPHGASDQQIHASPKP